MFRPTSHRLDIDDRHLSHCFTLNGTRKNLLYKRLSVRHNFSEQSKSIVDFAHSNPAEFLYMYSYWIVGMILLALSLFVLYLSDKKNFTTQDTMNRQAKNETLKTHEITYLPWECPSCGEKNETQFDTCWNCQHLNEYETTPIQDKLTDMNHFDMENSFDLSTLDIQWTALKSGGSFFRTYKLLEKSPMKMELHPTLIWQIMYFILFFLSLFTIIAIFSRHYHHQEDSFYLSSSALIMLGTAGLLYFQTTSIIIDRKAQAIWRVKKYSRNKAKEEYIAFKHIAALQLIRKYVSGYRLSFFSYELNYILKSGERIYITDYANREVLTQDAKELSKFLNVPLLKE